MNRTDILSTASEIVSKDRNTTHGEPEDNFRNIADLWTAYNGVKYTPAEVAIFMILVKIARTNTSPHVADHWIDIAGYAACGGQCATKDTPDK